jgi:hypothetical protein
MIQERDLSLNFEKIRKNDVIRKEKKIVPKLTITFCCWLPLLPSFLVENFKG